MSISLNVLNHLGLNLYSNVPSVLSEAVANAWDADATQVDVDLFPEEERIEITDNGHGMDEEDVNHRYLHVGYRRREDEDRPETTPKFDREPMGRKGIGKLSLFSIARTVKVYTTDGNVENAFKMTVDGIKEAIGEEDSNGETIDPTGRYSPTVLNEFPEDLDQGTKIVLTDLKKKIYNTEEALRKRVARRFSIIGEQHDFQVSVNKNEVDITDRDYFHKLQFIWTIDDGEDYGTPSQSYEDFCTNLAEDPIQLDDETPDGYEIKGWIGAVEKPKELEVTYGDKKDDLNKITLMMRGKMAQEDLLENYNDAGVYTSYLVGEIHADHLDADDMDDIATSDRESIKENSPRFGDLLDFIDEQLRQIRSDWDELRDKQGSDKAREIDAIEDWYDSLDREHHKRKAQSLFGKINKITTDSEEERRELFKYGVLAFERLRYKENLDKLNRISVEDLEAASEVFVDLDDIEATLYHQIVQQRLNVINKLQEAIDKDAKERVLQEHLFDNLWLLDPSWERATDSKVMEQQINTEFQERYEEVLSGDQRKGRVDIKYRKTTGQHVIVELKRPGRDVTSYELADQANRYIGALEDVLEARDEGHETVKAVCVVGRKPKNWRDQSDQREEQNREALEKDGIRILRYQKLLNDAQKAYQSYIDGRNKANRIAGVIDQLDTANLSE